jgi:hypothetical protein
MCLLLALTALPPPPPRAGSQSIPQAAFNDAWRLVSAAKKAIEALSAGPAPTAQHEYKIRWSSLQKLKAEREKLLRDSEFDEHELPVDLHTTEQPMQIRIKHLLRNSWWNLDLLARLAAFLDLVRWAVAAAAAHNGTPAQRPQGRARRRML